MLPTEAEVLAQLRKGVLDYAVLALLREAPAYGLEIADGMAEFAPLFGSEGTLYPLLTRLRRQGWVSDAWQESSSGPPRRYYAISADGRAALAVFLSTWGRFRAAVDRAVADAPAQNHLDGQADGGPDVQVDEPSDHAGGVS